MIDATLRLERLSQELVDDDCGVILMDLVLGHGAHPDPATDLATAIEHAQKPVVISVIGTRDDPQGYDNTIRRLVDAGAIVHASNAAAAREAVSLAGGTAMTRPLSAATVVTAGAALLADALDTQGVDTERVEWTPPVAGTEDALTQVMLDPRRHDANVEAVRRMTSATASLVDVRPASDVLGLERGHFLHAGPPIEWDAGVRTDARRPDRCCLLRRSCQ